MPTIPISQQNAVEMGGAEPEGSRELAHSRAGSRASKCDEREKWKEREREGGARLKGGSDCRLFGAPTPWSKRFRAETLARGAFLEGGAPLSIPSDSVRADDGIKRAGRVLASRPPVASYFASPARHRKGPA